MVPCVFVCVFENILMIFHKDNDMSDQEIDWEEWDASKTYFITHMIAGSFAGLAEHVTLFPVDTLKTHLQCQRCGSSDFSQTWIYSYRLIEKEGILRLWRGVSTMFAACIPGIFQINLLNIFNLVNSTCCLF